MIPSEGWLPDPSGRHEFRHFDQHGPTAWVSDGGQVFEDPIASDQAHADPLHSASTHNHVDPTALIATDPTPLMVAGGAAATATARPTGWYRNASNPDEVRYWDGLQWVDRAAEPPDPDRRPQDPAAVMSRQPAEPASTPPEGWHSDPLGRYKFRWLTAGVATRLVSDDDGKVTFDEPDEGPARDRSDIWAPDGASALAPAEWYPDPANPARLRYWDGSGWTKHILHETPAHRSGQ